MDAVSQLQELAEKNGVSLEELCVYALGTKDEQAALEGNTEKTSTETGETFLEEDNSNEEFKWSSFLFETSYRAIINFFKFFKKFLAEPKNNQILY